MDIENTPSNQNSIPGDSISDRKARHLQICTDPVKYHVEGGTTMMNEVRFVHRALPELNYSEIDTRTEFLDYPTRLPLFISSMTGGSEEGYRVNRDLAQVAQESGIAIGTGSIRVLFRYPEMIDQFRLKAIAADVPVFANIGGVQLRDPDQAALIELTKRLEVDGIAVHLNPGQELIQPEGDRDFRGILDGIRRLCDASPVPVIVKETGFGIGPTEATRLLDSGARYVDVAGSGGTNWITVESHRLGESDRLVAEEYADWGESTAVLLAATRSLPGSILASGGIRSGLDVAKSVALGAVSAGLALPFAREVMANGVDAGLALVDRLRRVLETTMLMTSSRTVEELRHAPLIWTRHFTHTVEQILGDTGAPVAPGTRATD